MNDFGELTRFDAAEWLTSPEAVRDYLVAAAEEEDPQFLLKSFGVVVRASGFESFAESIDRPAAELRSAIRSGSDADILTVLDVMRCIGWRLAPVEHEERAEAA